MKNWKLGFESKKLSSACLFWKNIGSACQKVGSEPTLVGKINVIRMAIFWLKKYCTLATRNVDLMFWQANSWHSSGHFEFVKCKIKETSSMEYGK